MKKVTVILGAVLLAGCPSEARDRVLVARAAEDFGCAQQDVEVAPLEGERYAARGCGHKGLYICSPPKNPFKENYTCVPVAPPPGPTPAAASTRPAP